MGTRFGAYWLVIVAVLTVGPLVVLLGPDWLARLIALAGLFFAVWRIEPARWSVPLLPPDDIWIDDDADRTVEFDVDEGDERR